MQGVTQLMAERTLGNQFMLLCALGVIISSLGFVFLEPMLKVFGATESVMAYSKIYTGILLLGAPFNMLGTKNQLSNLYHREN